MKTIAAITLTLLMGTASAQMRGNEDYFCVAAIGIALACQTPEREQIFETCIQIIEARGRMTEQETIDGILGAEEEQKKNLDGCERARYFAHRVEMDARSILMGLAY